MDDPEKPEVWFLLFLRAVVGLQLGSRTEAVAYLRFTETHRGRPAAEHAQAQLKRAAISKPFETAQARLIKLQKAIASTTDKVA